MDVVTKYLKIRSNGPNDMLDITKDVQGSVDESGIKDGIVLVFCPGSTGALSTVEFEPGLMEDVPEMLNKIAPYGKDYKHHATWHDDNGSGHLKSTLLGPDLTVPLIGGTVVTGTWQQIVFIECDTRARDRELIVQIMGK